MKEEESEIEGRVSKANPKSTRQDSFNISDENHSMMKFFKNFVVP